MVMGSWEFLGGGFELPKKKVNHYVPLCSNNFRNSPNLTFIGFHEMKIIFLLVYAESNW